MGTHDRAYSQRAIYERVIRFKSLHIAGISIIPEAVHSNANTPSTVSVESVSKRRGYRAMRSARMNDLRRARCV